MIDDGIIMEDKNIPDRDQGVSYSRMGAIEKNFEERLHMYGK